MNDITNIQAWVEDNSQAIAAVIAHYLQDKKNKETTPVPRLGRIVHQPKKNETPADWLYTGYRDERGLCIVRRKNTERTPYGAKSGGSQRLSLRQDVYNHGNGFEWGYGGSGPAQLAIAMLVQYLHKEIGDTEWKDKSIRWHQHFKSKYIATLPRDSRWFITTRQMKDFVHEMEESSGVNR